MTDRGLPAFSRFASSVRSETAFTVLALARALQAGGKDVIELEIGDSPFPTPEPALEAGIRALREGDTGYGPSLGIPGFRAAAAAHLSREYDLDLGPEHVIAGPGAKNFEQLFCEAFLDPGDGVLVFSPHFPTYPPNIHRRGARAVLSPLDPERGFRPDLDDVRRFLERDPSPRAVFLNSPHNPTGGVLPPEDLEALAGLIIQHEERDGTTTAGGDTSGRGERRPSRGRIAVFSDEPYDRMVWSGRHHTPLEIAGLRDRTVAAYTFSKSFGMSGWRLGFAVAHPDTVAVLGKLTNTSISCVPPFTQRAGVAALEEGLEERDRNMEALRRKVEILVDALDRIDGVECAMPGGSFYAFPSVAGVCERHGITSHGLALYLLEGADPARGVACLGGECFGDAGAGFLRFSCAQPDDRMAEAVSFIAEAVEREDRVAAYLAERPTLRLDAAASDPLHPTGRGDE